MGEIAYTYENKRGFSRSIIEAKKRNTFIVEMKFITIPSDIKMNELQIFIEKGFRYGDDNIYQTIPLENSEKKYQLIIANEYETGYFLKCKNFPIMEKWEISSPLLIDTLYFDIYTTNDYRKEPVGLMKAWDPSLKK
jgi:hypothetical protein